MQNKVLARLSRYLKVEAAVSDIPSELREAVNKHWRDGFKGFVKELYRASRMDLNTLTPEIKVFKRLSQPEIDKCTKDGGLLVIAFNYSYQEGVILLSSGITDLYMKGREEEGVDLGNGYYRILGRPRNVVTLINKPDIEYKAWAFSFPNGSTREKRELRDKQKEGAIFRTPEQFQNWMSNFDKSGYKIDKNKYKDILKKIREEGGMWVKKVDKVMKDFLDLQSKISAAKKIGNLSYPLKDAMKAISEATMHSWDSWYSDKEREEQFKKAEKQLDYLRERMKKEGIKA